MKNNIFYKTKYLKYKRKYKLLNKHYDSRVLINFKNTLVESSLIFITNVITALMCKNYIYSYLFLFLTTTSVVYHSTKEENNERITLYTNILDKIGIALVVLYGAYTLYNKRIDWFTQSIIIILFLVTIFLYIYGYYTNQYCFHTQKCTGEKYHSLLHYISSFAHHLIIIM
jgi:hypothetical protein